MAPVAVVAGEPLTVSPGTKTRALIKYLLPRDEASTSSSLYFMYAKIVTGNM